MDVSQSLAESYEHCRRVTRGAGSSFYYPLWLLPRKKRRAMHALYAFCRIADDIGDGQEPLEVRRQRLCEYRAALAEACQGNNSAGEFPALIDTVRTFHVPPQYLTEILDGVAMDFMAREYATWNELRNYCYHVAGAVGLACLAIWGGHVPEVQTAAIRCGEAFQLTNILRDVREDALNGRVYLPQDDLAEFACQREDLCASAPNERLRRLIGRQVRRAREAFTDATTLTKWIPRDSQGVYIAMWKTYRRLLAKIERRDGDVFSQRVRLSRAERLWIVGTAWRRAPLSAGTAP